jgi:polar amino acid transport system substrate-binding protein
MSDAKTELAPTGRMRAAINRGNAVLVQQGPDGEIKGIAVDLARALAGRLGAPLDLLVYDAAGKVFEASNCAEWDIAFLAVDPVRASEIDFTSPYVVIEGNYVLPKRSGAVATTDIERSTRRIAVVEGSAYDLHVSRTVTSPTLVRLSSVSAAFEQLDAGEIDAIAGVRQALAFAMSSREDLQLVEPAFMEIRQAMATPKGRPAGIAYLRSFIEEMKASSFVKRSLERAGQHDAVVPTASVG